MSTILMFGGALIKWWAVSNTFTGELFGYQMQVIWACLGFALYGVGAEIAGITVSKVIVKWFTGHELALAMGAQVALARFGTAAALSFALPFAKNMGAVSASIGLGAAMLCIGMLSFIVYNIMDKKEDAAVAASASGTDSAAGAFGVIALVAMTPLIAIQILGIIFKLKTRKKEVKQ